MNKPVAYVNNMCNDSIDWKVDPMDLEEGTPLYTHPVKEQVETIEYTCPNCQTHVGLHVKHPVKELTDEEILEVWDEDCVVLDEDKLVIRFAKAILRKAQEK